uniref:Enoyl reductase (ER) domain-containing protein n=1 Tax=Trichobilharzia regenti TaxID=157069 RepID=A0AA85J2D4_TRIRE|nr:unnamed protein product [Trichobilharzia regenti]
MSKQLPRTISAWQLMNFLRPGSSSSSTTTTPTPDITSELHLTKTRRMPSIIRPDQILIKVKAASLNPVDSLLIYGYGSSSFNLLRRFTSPCGCFGVPNIENTMTSENNSGFPFTPGRDFAGEIVDIGPEVKSSNRTNNIKISIGTNVAGATWPFLSSTGSGALAEYIICPAEYVAPLPKNVSYLHAAALGYAGLTAWSALVDTGGIRPVRQRMSQTTRTPSQLLSNNLILITGATGGVGFIAAQLAKLWGWRVHVTCPGDDKALALMKSLEVEEVFPYPTKIPNTLKYDLILDCIRPEYINTATPFSPSSSSPSSSASSTSSSSSTNKQSSNTLLNNILPYIPPTLSYLNTSSNQSRYIMLNPSLLHLTDYWGPFLGTGLAFTQLISTKLAATFSVKAGDSITSLNNCNIIRWAFFKPNRKALQAMLTLLSNGELIIPIDTVYNFMDVPKAFNRLYAKGVRGKLVIEMNK